MTKPKPELVDLIQPYFAQVVSLVNPGSCLKVQVNKYIFNSNIQESDCNYLGNYKKYSLNRSKQLVVLSVFDPTLNLFQVSYISEQEVLYIVNNIYNIAEYTILAELIFGNCWLITTTL